MEGDLSQFPTPGLSNLVPGIWIQPNPAMSNDFGSMPREMEQSYFFRIIYVRLLAKNENFVSKNMLDSKLIGNTYTDHYYLTDITNLPSGTFTLWSIIKSVEFSPPEDRFVQQIHADLAAIAMNMEVRVKTLRAR